jgi:hypothetical protein
MDLSGALRPLVFLHVFSVLVFVLFHGISLGVALRLRRERDESRVRTLLELSSGYLSAAGVGLVGILLTGILAGIAAGWWTTGRLWIWVSLVLFIAIGIAMGPLGRGHLDRIRTALGMPTAYGQLRDPSAAGTTDIGELLASRRPMIAAVVGLGGLTLILYLMMFKPF